jgi:hypothetical protein
MRFESASKLLPQCTANVAVGSFATELVKVEAGACPLRSESDRNIAVPRMNAIAMDRGDEP